MPLTTTTPSSLSSSSSAHAQLRTLVDDRFVAFEAAMTAAGE
jgi:hypothetical protein